MITTISVYVQILALIVLVSFEGYKNLSQPNLDNLASQYLELLKERGKQHIIETNTKPKLDI